MKNGTIAAVKEINDNTNTYFMSVFIDSKERIWAASSGKGLFQIQQSPEGKINVIHYTAEDELSSNYIFDITEDAEGNLWFATFGEGLLKYDDQNKFSDFRFSLPSANNVICIQPINNDELIFGTRTSGAFRIHKNNPEQLQQISGTENEQVWSICAEKDRFWLSTKNKGVICSDPSYSMSMKEGLGANEIFKLLADRENNIWIGCNSAGLIKFSGKKFVHITNNELPELNFPSSFSKDQFGKYFAGSSTGLYHFSFTNNKINHLKKYGIAEGLTTLKITSLCHDQNQNLWIGTEKGLCKLNPNQSIEQIASEKIIDPFINSVFCDSKNQVWIGTPAGLSILNAEGEIRDISESNGLINNEVQCFTEDNIGNIWIGTFGGLMRFDGKVLESFSKEDGLLETRIQCLDKNTNGTIYIGTFGGGIFQYNPTNKKINRICETGKLISGNIYSLKISNDSLLIAGTNRGLCKIILGKNSEVRYIKNIDRFDGYKFVESNLNAITLGPDHILFGTPKGITAYYPGLDEQNQVKPNLIIDEVYINKEKVTLTEKFELEHNKNSIIIKFSGVSLTNPNNNKYFAKLSDVDSTWHKLIIDKQNPDEFISVEYKKLQPGNYKLLLRASNNDGVYSEEKLIEFHIDKPFYKKAPFIISSVLFILISFFVLLRVREKKLQREKEILEEIVVERTAEIVASKKEIEAQKDLLEIQKTEITDSINYSKRIQNAILPELPIFQQELPNAFILYKPRDIVSGDFYHFGKLKNGSFYVAAADCTGHGVPGAFMSMIGSKEIYESAKNCNEPGEILALLNQGMKFSLKQSNPELGIKDGMDVALVSIQKTAEGAIVKYAGANRPFLLVKNGGDEIVETKATKTAIGGYTPDEQIFEQHEFNLKTGDTFYLSSDGYADQFGGANGKKMMTKKFKEILVGIHHLPMKEQQTYLMEYFNNWKGKNYEQVDDVLIIGVKV
ncbi:MAG: SpoIIE family protein phosphatase [Sphingobacteriaceae bacterium]|nr:SpoIIE family protein phosphatase [Sphingobacteriaceae bacterium]